MKHISIVVYEDAVLSSLSSIYSLLFSANEMAKKETPESVFNIELIGAVHKNVQLNLPVQFICTKTIAEEFTTDLLIIPPISTFSTSINAVLKKNTGLIEWIRYQHSKGVEITSLCTGSYFLAEAGLLNGKEATSHWSVIEDMQRRYPEIKLKPDEIVTHNNGICTGGGAYSSLNTILYLVEKYYGKPIAIALSKEYSIDYSRVSQSVFAIFQGQRHHNDTEVHKAQDYIELNFKNGISVEQIAEQVNMSKRNFIRRFKMATHNNPIEYIQRIKIEAAKKAIEAGENNIARITYDVGYNDLKTFRGLFKKITGYSPQGYQKIYNR